MNPLTSRTFAEDESTPTSAISRAVEKFVKAWRSGECPRADDFLSRHPEFGDDDAIRLIFEEACIRRELGESSVTEDILRRFPAHRDQLVMLLECDRIMRGSPTVVFPEAGDRLGDFRLDMEIGRGATGRTYLASQVSLADRPVVLKVTPIGHDEHLSLARLRHMHIVPLYFEQEFPDRFLRVLGMPYLGGTTLARVLETSSGIPFSRRSGRGILDAIDRYTHSYRLETIVDGPFRAFLRREKYTRAICWIGACLADALQYAHDRNLVHLDIKPSNVLLAGDGRPLLLDFHLARAPIGRGFPSPERLGGTIGYMSPEQSEAIRSIERGDEVITTGVDGRSDIFSLGVLLYEALSGCSPSVRGGVFRSLRRENPEVSTGLSDIIRKCLAENPDDRYSDAGALARDLRRHISDQSLQGVANRSVVERWTKRLRRPGGIASVLLRLTVVAAVVAAGVWGVIRYRQWNREIVAAVAESRKELRAHRYDEAEIALRRGLELTAMLPEEDWRKQDIRRRLNRVAGERAAERLHDLVDRLRFRIDFITPESAEFQSLLRRGTEIWSTRGLFIPLTRDPLRTELQRRIRTDFQDFAAIWADVAARSRRVEGSDTNIRDALRILIDARDLFGASPALIRDIQRYRRSLGETAEEHDPPSAPQTAWEHFDLGRSYFRSGDYASAERSFQKSVDLNPREFWPQFYWGICAYRESHYHDSVTALGACIALSPAAECYHNRAKAHEALGATDRAFFDYSKALEINPNLAEASLNRGVIHFHEGRLDNAIVDLELARRTASDPETRGIIDYNLALTHLARHDTAAAKKYLESAIALGDADARSLVDRLEKSRPPASSSSPP
jgi:serine/threonine protein kinase/Flp pilus assembly protein TadD